MVKSKIVVIFVLYFLLSSCTSSLIKHDYVPSRSLNEQQYSAKSTVNGVILLAVNWNRMRNCGKFATAELASLGFDLLPQRYKKDKQRPDLFVNGTPGRPGFMNYAFLVAPGEYGISLAQIKVSKTSTDVGYNTSARSDLFKSGIPKGGSFTVAAGETVYIGHFGLDCNNQPKIWRYYVEDRIGFQKYLEGYHHYYPYLDFRNIQYRLFKTAVFGRDYYLP